MLRGESQGEAAQAAASARPAVHAPALRIHRARVVFCLLVLYLIWGSAFLAIRIAIDAIPPLLMAGSRFLIAGVLLYAGLRLRGAPHPTREQWFSSAAIAMLMVVVANGAMVYAELWVDTGLTSIMISTSPLWAALFAGVRERWPSRSEWTGMAMGFAGVMLLNVHASLRAHPLAATVLVLSSISWSLGSILSRHARLPAGLMASAAQMLTGGLVLVILGGLVGEWSGVRADARSMVAMLYLALLSSLIGYSAYTYLIHNTRPALALSYSYVNPVVALALGAIFLGERITALEIVAMLMTVSAVIFILQGRSHHEHHREPAALRDPSLHSG